MNSGAPSGAGVPVRSRALCRSTKRLAQEQMEAAAGGESPRTPHSARGAEAAAADTAPAPINTAYQAVIEVPPGPVYFRRD